jgi:glyoxylase-like metal-dependent hydrolase (beta-lactamase superfamily II)
MMTRRILVILASVACALVAQGPPKAELYSGETTKISGHVWVMTGNPNIAIVVGTPGTLVVDTGLGAPNGEVIARTAQKLSPAGTKLYLTTTHFHPEHGAGEPGFPSAPS